MVIDDFITRWKASGGSERANFQQFAIELTQLLSVDAPKPATADAQSDDYRFERPVTFIHTGTQSRGFVDLYRRGSFIMEAKQGVHRTATDDDQLSLLPDSAKQRQGHGQRGSARWDDTMLRARNQADGYARAVARTDGWPPFLLIVDVGHVIEVYADFSGQGQGYTQFPDGNRYRIRLEDLHDDAVRARLHAIWTDPHSLDPAKVAARVTREVAGHLAALGRSFEGQGHESEDVAHFLMRCLFTMFAQSVDLIPHGSFTALLHKLRGTPDMADTVLSGLFRAMDKGEKSETLLIKLKQFNGFLFKDATALPLSALQLGLLIEAATHDWREVEPAIFGTLLERALDKRQRHKLGAHYTPRAYVERLVMPTVIEPLRADWRDVQAAALTLANQGKLEDARAEVRGFHRQLCNIRVLDPACGSGNFLYVALELMKRLEGEVIALLTELGEEQGALSLAGHTVDPHQFLGLELNPWAAAVAELVLWIGYLQWHFRTHGKASPAEPVLRDFKNIENRDAVLEWAARRERLNEHGEPVTRWDGINTVTHPVTGLEVPDPDARIQVYDYLKPQPAEWPEADFIVGNPPFIGKLKFREDLGDGYVEALRKAYPDVPDSADFVMYWWHKAALAVQSRDENSGKGCRRFGLITTRAAKQTFNVRVIQAYVVDPQKPLSLVFAIPDHPWVDTVFAAKVRIAMTVVTKGRQPGRLMTVMEESRTDDAADGWSVRLNAQIGTIRPNLIIGADILSAGNLKSNADLCSMGFATGSRGFFIERQQISSVPESERVLLRSILSTNEVTAYRKNRKVIDAWGVQSEEELRSKFPWIYQWLKDRVFPQRSANNDPKLRREWWRFRRSNQEYRALKSGLPRFIVAPETSKHRIFLFEPWTTDVEHGAYGFGLSDAWFLSIMSSHIHDVWALAQGGDLGVTPRYNKTRCFDPFPFPEATYEQKAKLRLLGEELDAHRKARQAEYPKLTLTGMYNILEKLRAGERIEGKDREVYDQGLIGILRDLHDQIDAATAQAYGWPVTLTDDDILQNLVTLNRTRAAEEARGEIRWLRPDYQNPAGHTASKGEQTELDVGSIAATAKTPWPTRLPDQIAAVRATLQDMGEATPEQIARHFARARTASVQPLLESLTALGQARMIEGGRFAA